MAYDRTAQRKALNEAILAMYACQDKSDAAADLSGAAQSRVAVANQAYAKAQSDVRDRVKGSGTENDRALDELEAANEDFPAKMANARLAWQAYGQKFQVSFKALNDSQQNPGAIENTSGNV